MNCGFSFASNALFVGLSWTSVSTHSSTTVEIGGVSVPEEVADDASEVNAPEEVTDDASEVNAPEEVTDDASEDAMDESSEDITSDNTCHANTGGLPSASIHCDAKSHDWNVFEVFEVKSAKSVEREHFELPLAVQVSALSPLLSNQYTSVRSTSLPLPITPPIEAFLAEESTMIRPAAKEFSITSFAPAPYPINPPAP